MGTLKRLKDTKVRQLAFVRQRDNGGEIHVEIYDLILDLDLCEEAPILTTWLNWFASDAIGVITIAPLVIGLARTLHDPPEASELKEGSLALVVLAVVSAIGFGAPKHYWFTILPLSLLFPLLLWPAAHCRPVFAAAAAFIVAQAVVGTITFGIGRLGDPSMRLADRVHAAEVGLLAVSACALVLAALFAERRRNEGALKDSNEALKDSNDRLQLALDGAELGVWSVDAKTGRFENDMRDRWIHGHPPDLPSKTVEEVRSFIHPDDLPNLDAAFAASSRAGGSCKIEYRLAPELRQLGAGQERWIAVEGTVVRGADGRPVRIIGVTRDVTERKRAEEQQRVLMAELDHRVKNVLATVSAVAGHTLETSSSMSHFVAALDGRIRSMASAHEILSIQRWQGMPLAELVRRELAAYSTSSNTAVDGPDVMLIAEAGQAMAMVIHELVTNAAKYGALSTQSGRVSVRWYRKLNGSAQLVFVWEEAGGPKVRAPKKSGYGTGVVRDLVAYEFGGTVDLSFAPEGVRCRLEIPIDRISCDSPDISRSEQLHHSGDRVEAP